MEANRGKNGSVIEMNASNGRTLTRMRLRYDMGVCGGGVASLLEFVAIHKILTFQTVMTSSANSSDP